MKEISILINVFAFCTLIHGQSAADWTWYNPAIFVNSVQGLEQDPNGDIWMASGTKIIKYDGVNWIAFDVLNSGLPIANAYPRSIDASLGNKLWISTSDRVVEYDLANDLWYIHDPSHGAVNFNAFGIKVESQNRIWWATGSRLWEYNGTLWTSYKFSTNGLHINSNSISQIVIDNNKNKWMTTPSSICIEGGCSTPAGLIKLSDSDTLFFDGDHYGFPDATYTLIDLKSNNDPILVVHEPSINPNFYITYTNGQWSAPTDIPFDGFIYDMKLGNEDQIYLAFGGFIAIGKDGIWDVVPLDTKEIEYVSSILVTPENDLYVAGRSPDTGNGKHGVLGYLPNLQYRIRGTLYSDKNDNGTFDLADVPIKDHFVQTTNQDRISFSNNDGDYSMLFSSPGTYTIEGLLPAYYSYGNPVDGQYTASLSLATPTSDDNDIGFKPDTSAIDLSVTMTAISGANPGFQSCYMISVKNLAPGSRDGDITVTFDDLLTFEYSNIPPGSVNGNQFTFHVTGLDWLEVFNIKLCFSLPADPELLNDTLHHFVSVIPVGGPDLDPQNNSYSLSQVITGSYDPNFLEVYPKGKGESGDIPVTTHSLEYTIHFQNVGTDTARNVTIINPINDQLDISTVNILGASHPFDIGFIEDGRKIQWSFDHINLPDSSANREASNGFVKYTIDLANHDIGTVIPNNAEISFDFNPSISTNTTINTLIKDTTTGIENSKSEECHYTIQYLDGQLLLHFPVMDKYRIGIYDLNGRKLYSYIVHNIEQEISLGHLPGACYVVSVVSDRCQETKKIFIK